MNKKEYYRESIKFNDSLSFNKEYYDHNSALKTDITFVDYLGNQIVSIKKHRGNMTVLGGRLSILEKAFGITPDKNKRLFISDMIPNPNDTNNFYKLDDETDYKAKHDTNTIFNNDSNQFNNFVKYFCIGNGGENPNTPYAIYDVHDWETRLYNMVPFRCVSTSQDLNSEERKQYAMKKIITIDNASYYAYYAKKFEITGGVINSKKSDVDYIPESRDSEPYTGDTSHTMSGYTSNIYLSFDLDISELEFKEFYQLTHSNSLTGARLTELGLISALEADGEIYDPTLFAKLIHEPVFLNSEGSKRKIKYSIYV